jgi:hypothetical protein
MRKGKGGETYMKKKPIKYVIEPEVPKASPPDSCANCRFWNKAPKSDDTFNVCRKYPPASAFKSIPHESDWCGQWESK